MLAIPFKLSGDSKSADWDKALLKFVSRSYSPQQAEAHKAQFAAVAEQRKQVLTIVTRGVTPTTAADTEIALRRYFRLLCAIEKRFEGADLRMQFSWKDAFDHVAKQGEADVHFESAAVLFNLLAVSSYMAVHQSRADADGIKLACQRYQQTAGLIEALVAHVSGTPWSERGTIDLTQAMLQMMRKLMLAQAQRCFYEKAALESMSPKLLCKIAAQVSVGVRGARGVAIVEKG